MNCPASNLVYFYVVYAVLAVSAVLFCVHVHLALNEHFFF